MGALEDLAAEIGISTTQLRDNLLSNQQANESLNPNYLTVTPSGQIGATFSGHVAAQGIDLPEDTAATLTPPSGDPHLVDWLDGGGTIQEWIYGAAWEGLLPEGGHVLKLYAGANGAARNAYLEVLTDNQGPSRINVGLDSAGGAATIMNGSGASSFLQLLSTQKRQLDFETVTIANGASAQDFFKQGLWLGEASYGGNVIGAVVAVMGVSTDGLSNQEVKILAQAGIWNYTTVTWNVVSSGTTTTLELDLGAVAPAAVTINYARIF